MARISWKGQLVLSQSEPVPYGSSWNNMEGLIANQTLVLWMFGSVLNYL